MNIELRRIRHRPHTIDGQILIDGQKVCDCAENAHHCLPPGSYGIELIRSKKYSRKMPSLIPNPSSLILFGNGVYNRTDGSILVGKYIAPGCLSHSKPAFDAIYDRIRKNIERGNDVTLVITSEGSGIRV